MTTLRDTIAKAILTKLHRTEWYYMIQGYLPIRKLSAAKNIPSQPTWIGLVGHGMAAIKKQINATIIRINVALMAASYWLCGVRHLWSRSVVSRS